MEQMHIKPDSDRILSILDKLRKGHIVIPRFQRDFIWSPTQIVEFFDSILKGYPIGTVILWVPERDQFKIYKDIEGVVVGQQGNDKRGLCYVLDGRQRTTTLLSVLCSEGNNSQKYYYDLEKDQVVSWNKENPPSKLNLISIHDAFDTMTLVEYLERLRASNLGSSDIEAYAMKAKTINKKLMDYEIGHITVQGGGISDAVEIFSRLNSKTTLISTDFMIQALAYEPEEDFLFADAITDIKNDIAEFGLGDIQRDTILKCVYNYTSSTFIDGKAADIIASKENLQDIMEQVRNDVYNTARFLSEECRVIDSRLLPYTYQFVMLSLFFKHNKDVSDENKGMLKRWFFYTTYSAYFSNTSLGGIRTIIQRFENYCKGAAATPMDFAPELRISPLTDTFGLNSARGCAYVLAQLCSMTERLASEISYFDIYTVPQTGKRNAGNTVLCFSKADKTLLSHLFRNSRIVVSNAFLETRGLSLPLLHLYWDNDFNAFCEQRALEMKTKEEMFIKTLFPKNSILFTN